MDHFASAKILFHYHSANLAEASIINTRAFQALQESSFWVFADEEEDASALVRQGDEVATSAVLKVLSDVRQVRTAVRKVGGVEDVEGTFGCKYAYWPGRQMACRD